MGANQMSGVPSRAERETISYYEANAKAYAEQTRSLDMHASHLPFLLRIPEKGRILDAGCGGGRDTLAFLRSGRQVVSYDASRQLASEAARLTNTEVAVLRHQDITYEGEFDGVWASATLLHVSRAELTGVLDRLRRALKNGGTLWASFKSGTKDTTDEYGRRFTNFTCASLREFLGSIPGLSVVDIYETADGSRANVRWVCFLAERVS